MITATIQSAETKAHIIAHLRPTPRTLRLAGWAALGCGDFARARRIAGYLDAAGDHDGAREIRRWATAEDDGERA